MNMPNFYIATPSYNAEQFINSAVSNIVNQAGEFILHYHIQDGGSTDGTVAEIRRWEALLSRKNPIVRCAKLHFTWSSEPDSGMYDALNKAFDKLAVPDDGIMAWCNTDDQYLPQAFATAARVFADLPDLQWMGGGMLVNADGVLNVGSDCRQPYPPELVREGCCDIRCWRHLHQAPMFWKGRLWRKAGPPDAMLRYAGDYELWTRFARHADFAHLDVPFSLYASHPEQLSRACDAQGTRFYEMEKEQVRPLAERQRIVRAFWKKRLRPPLGPSLRIRDGRYQIVQCTAWPAWGQGWLFYRYRLRYYLRQAVIWVFSSIFTHTSPVERK
jgi:glycosyltransferase involved in cell wall biosynthesis